MIFTAQTCSFGEVITEFADKTVSYIEQMGIVFITVFNWPSPDKTR